MKDDCGTSTCASAVKLLSLWLLCCPVTAVVLCDSRSPALVNSSQLCCKFGRQHTDSQTPAPSLPSCSRFLYSSAHLSCVTEKHREASEISKVDQEAIAALTHWCTAIRVLQSGLAQHTTKVEHVQCLAPTKIISAALHSPPGHLAKSPSVALQTMHAFVSIQCLSNIDVSAACALPGWLITILWIEPEGPQQMMLKPT
jgi:hypothetical protein